MVKSSKSQLQRVWSSTNPSLLEVTQSLFLETHGSLRNIGSHLNGGVICLETSNLKIFPIQGRKRVGRKKNPCATATLRKNVPGPGCREKSPTNLWRRPGPLEAKHGQGGSSWQRGARIWETNRDVLAAIVLDKCSEQQGFRVSLAQVKVIWLDIQQKMEKFGHFGWHE